MKYQINLKKYEGMSPEDIKLLTAVLESQEKLGKRALDAFDEVVACALVQLFKRGEIIYYVDAKGQYQWRAPSTPVDKMSSN